ncbi:MAG: hypothetical protein AAF806_09350 [Bacteroidota bacterium]
MNNTFKLGAVILARYSSRRLPGKALMGIEGKKVLEYIFERLLTVLDRSQLVLATSDEGSDDPIENFAIERGIKCFRGSLENVSERFYQAAKQQGWDYAIRINGDNIFTDTKVLRDMIAIVEKGQYDFVSNVKGRSFPKGMSIEIVSLDYYAQQLPKIENDSNYKEHVTLYLYEHDKGRKHYYFMNTQFPEAAGIQLALDTPEDFERSKRLIAQFRQPHYLLNLADLLKYL